jgi:hypothetical protein
MSISEIVHLTAFSAIHCVSAHQNNMLKSTNTVFSQTPCTVPSKKNGERKHKEIKEKIYTKIGHMAYL